MVLARSLPENDRMIAGYRVIEDIVRGPGTSMVRACGPDGRSYLLQLIHCRGAERDAEHEAWSELARRIACATAEVRRSLLPGIFEHGIADAGDGTRVLFWVLPWHDAVKRLGRAIHHVRNVEQLLSVATDLLEILVSRHDSGWVEPLLSEWTLIVGCGEPARIAGVPMFVDSEWESEAAEHARRAPEEISRRHPSRTGDLWRLGMTLAALSRNLDDGPLPGSIVALIESLASPDPRNRPSSAASALANLKRIVRGQVSGIRWADPYAEEPTLTAIPAMRREAGMHDLATTLPPTAPAPAPNHVAHHVRRDRVLSVAIQALGVFAASALLTFGALQLLS